MAGLRRPAEKNWRKNDEEKTNMEGIMNSNNRTLYSRYSSPDEVKTSLHRIDFSKKNQACGGIPLYAEDGKVYVEDKDIHSLIVGSTGSKKTRLIGMPALRMYALAGESFIATDPKAELYRKTYQLQRKRDTFQKFTRHTDTGF